MARDLLGNGDEEEDAAADVVRFRRQLQGSAHGPGCARTRIGRRSGRRIGVPGPELQHGVCAVPPRRRGARPSRGGVAGSAAALPGTGSGRRPAGPVDGVGASAGISVTSVLSYTGNRPVSAATIFAYGRVVVVHCGCEWVAGTVPRSRRGSCQFAPRPPGPVGPLDAAKRPTPWLTVVYEPRVRSTVPAVEVLPPPREHHRLDPGRPVHRLDKLCRRALARVGNPYVPVQRERIEPGDQDPLVLLPALGLPARCPLQLIPSERRVRACNRTRGSQGSASQVVPVAAQYSGRSSSPRSPPAGPAWARPTARCHSPDPSRTTTRRACA
ncbi:hypothetical protein SALBM311S_11296 [Streptomyces alboniger]